MRASEAASRFSERGLCLTQPVRWSWKVLKKHQETCSVPDHLERCGHRRNTIGYIMLTTSPGSCLFSHACHPLCSAFVKPKVHHLPHVLCHRGRQCILRQDAGAQPTVCLVASGYQRSHPNRQGSKLQGCQSGHFMVRHLHVLGAI